MLTVSKALECSSLFLIVLPIFKFTPLTKTFATVHFVFIKDEEAEEAEEDDGIVHMLDSSVVSRHAFTAMEGDHDRLNRQRLQRSPNEMQAMQQERV